MALNLQKLLNGGQHKMMTYLDLLTELQSFDDDDLLKVVTLYDTSRNEFSPVGVNFHETDSPYLEI